MLLQHQPLPCLYNSHVSFSSFRPKPPFKFPTQTLQKLRYFQRQLISCSISKVHSYGTLDYERRPTVRWFVVYKRIFSMESPEMGSADVINQWENQGNSLTKWELGRIIKELRKYRKYERALQVYEWMRNRRERFRLTASDEAILVDLIAKVRGVTEAEKYFLKLKDDLKDKRIYGALLNAYVQAKMKKKAESLFDQMRSIGYTTDSLTYNVMMTMYMKLKEHNKVDSVALEMIEKEIPLDIYSYNIWLSSSGPQGLAEKTEEVFERMKQDMSVVPNWSTYSIMASVYIRLDQFEKAKEYLRMVEGRITGRDRIPYHYLLSLYGSIGEKEEVYRVWNTYKAIFPSIPNLGYHGIISSLIRMNDTESAETLYGEWLSVKSSYDPRIGNLLIGAYVKNGDIDKAFSFFDHMIEVGGKPNSSSWEFCAQGHMEERRISDALTCFKEAFKRDNSKSWRPKPRNVSAFFKACEEANDTASKEMLVDLLSNSGFLKDQSYAAYIGLPCDETSNGIDSPTGQHDEISNDGESEMLLHQLESGM